MKSDPIKRTPLHARHVQLGANMGQFAGYEMPLWYPTGTKKEHLAVISQVGLFDTSHMAAVTVAGEDAFDLLQHCFSRDLNTAGGDSTSIGRCVYGVFLDENAEVLDDAILYILGANQFLIVVNAGMGAAIAKHLCGHGAGKAVVIEDLTDRLGKLDVQGPGSAQVLMKIIDSQASVFESFPYFTFKGHYTENLSVNQTVRLGDGSPILLSRSGYTGEFGFELFVARDSAGYLWDQIIAAAEHFSVTPCGLAARDSLRVGAVLPLSHQDIGAWPFVNHPWSFALPYTKDRKAFTKSFLGAAALLRGNNAAHTYPFAGFDLRKVNAGESDVLDRSGEEIGTVLTCATDMAVGRHENVLYSLASPDKPAGFSPRGVCCGFVRVTKVMEKGARIVLRDRRREIPVEIVEDIRPHRTARMAATKFL